MRSIRCPNCSYVLTQENVTGFVDNDDWFFSETIVCPNCQGNVQLNYSENPNVRRLGWGIRATRDALAPRGSVPALRADDV